MCGKVVTAVSPFGAPVLQSSLDMCVHVPLDRYKLILTLQHAILTAAFMCTCISKSGMVDQFVCGFLYHYDVMGGTKWRKCVNMHAFLLHEIFLNADSTKTRVFPRRMFHLLPTLPPPPIT